MNLSTAMNHQAILIRAFQQVWTDALAFKHTHTQVLENLNKIYATDRWKKVPRHVREYCNGYKQCLYNNHYNHIIWVLPFNGIHYDKWNDLPEEGKEAYRTNKAEGIHVYKSDKYAVWYADPIRKTEKEEV